MTAESIINEYISERDKQVGGNHYKKVKIQPWDIINEYSLDFYLGNAIKYILRDKKDKIEDIDKAIHYLKYWRELNGK